MSRPSQRTSHAKRLAAAAASAAASTTNEAQLRQACEAALESACKALDIAWVPYQIERKVSARGAKARWADVIHGVVVVEYEAPGCFRGAVNAKLVHARAQLVEYTALLAEQEGRDPARYIMLAFDGRHADFGQLTPHERSGEDDRAWASTWEGPIAFDESCARRLLEHLDEDGRPLVHPSLLAALIGPESRYGDALLPAFFDALKAKRSSPRGLTALLFQEWRRLFGQVVGVQSTSLRALLARQGTQHGADYDSDHAAYLFALNTYIALCAKVVAALALAPAVLDLRSRRIGIARRIDALESGRLFEEAGVVNMVSGDFFSWYRSDPAWPGFAPHVEALVDALACVDFDTTAKSPASTRDLFKGLYESFVPRALRHALGEFYTPDWLAEHGLDRLGWSPSDALLDPTCGSGTFLIEAVRRRLTASRPPDAEHLLAGLHGFDLNPLAVLTAKASLAVFAAPFLDIDKPIRLPVYLADAVNPASRDIDGCLYHVLQTELGPRTFRLPASFVRRADFFALFNRVRELIDADYAAEDIQLEVEKTVGSAELDETQRRAMLGTWSSLVDLHRRGWNGIWCPIVADRFAAGAIEPLATVCGNPPWVKWSHLPREYADFIKPRCLELGAFSSDAWVGGIESDMSTVITLAVADQFLADGGKLGFFITGTVFTNESSEGFRQFRLHQGAVRCGVEFVEDFQDVKPFDGVTNHPVFLCIVRGRSTAWPVAYRVWRRHAASSRHAGWTRAAQFREACDADDLVALPVPGGNGHRPWLVGSADEHLLFAQVFGAGAGSTFVARKGVTTDRNGIFWVRCLGEPIDGVVRIRNEADIGKTKGIVARAANVEARHLYPLLRGRGVSAFSATVDDQLRILLPQDGMHGDPDLPRTSPLTHRFLRAFKDELEVRSSFKRFQARAGHPWWSLWSTGAYTFSPYKVVWRELAAGRFAAAYVGMVVDPVLGARCVVPDHKVYFIPVETESQAAYLTGLLNAPVVSKAIGAYAAQLSLGVSVAEYLHLPAYGAAPALQDRIAGVARAATKRATGATAAEFEELDTLARELLGIRG